MIRFVKVFSSTPVYSLLFAVVICACSGKKSAETKEAAALAPAPSFSADSAYSFVARQVGFGARVPASAAHQKCGDFLVETLRRFQFEVVEQKFAVTTYNGKQLEGRNIIGSYHPKAAKRIMLASHWDSRPFADQDTSVTQKPVPAANDGASGVGILLEIARILGNDKNNPDIGIDIILFDVEDWGSSGSTEMEYNGFCLGANYWATHRHRDNYTAYFGVLLDMVGAKNATFPKEGYSMRYAAGVVNTIWSTAAKLGYDNYFIDQDGGGITDDHVPVNEKAHFPVIDIIHQTINNPSRTFFEQWHTTYDDMSVIDKATLKAVGQTLVQVIYEEAAPIQ